jgi:hypothetical protein
MRNQNCTQGVERLNWFEVRAVLTWHESERKCEVPEDVSCRTESDKSEESRNTTSEDYLFVAHRAELILGNNLSFSAQIGEWVKSNSAEDQSKNR